MLDDRNCITDNLSEAISHDLIKRIDELVETLESYQPDVRPDLTPDELLKDMQFSQTFPGDLKFPETHEGFLDFHRTREEYLSKFKPKVTLTTIERWKRQAINIRSEPKPGAIMRKFLEIDRQLLKMEDMIYEAVAEYDIYIDSQIHS